MEKHVIVSVNESNVTVLDLSFDEDLGVSCIVIKLICNSLCLVHLPSPFSERLQE